MSGKSMGNILMCTALKLLCICRMQISHSTEAKKSEINGEKKKQKIKKEGCP